MALGQHQPVIPRMLDQTTAGFHQPTNTELANTFLTDSENTLGYTGK